jgi:hypothetical protein
MAVVPAPASISGAPTSGGGGFSTNVGGGFRTGVENGALPLFAQAPPATDNIDKRPTNKQTIFLMSVHHFRGGKKLKIPYIVSSLNMALNPICRCILNLSLPVPAH